MAYTKLYTLGVEDVLWVVGYSSGAGATQSKESDHLHIGGAESTVRTYVTNSVIDLTDYKILWLDATRSSYQGHFSAGTVQGDRTRDDAISASITAGTRTLTSLDITAANGNYYIKVDCTANGAGQYTYAYRIWLGEKPGSGGVGIGSPMMI